MCWHGHRDFFYALFHAAPDAIVITAKARYDGFEGFEANYPDTDTNIGPPISPIHYSQCCHCDQEITELAHILTSSLEVPYGKSETVR